MDPVVVAAEQELTTSGEDGDERGARCAAITGLRCGLLLSLVDLGHDAGPLRLGCRLGVRFPACASVVPTGRVRSLRGRGPTPVSRGHFAARTGRHRCGTGLPQVRGMSPQVLCRRRWLNRSTYSRVAISTCGRRGSRRGPGRPRRRRGRGSTVRTARPRSLARRTARSRCCRSTGGAPGRIRTCATASGGRCSIP